MRKITPEQMDQLAYGFAADTAREIRAACVAINDAEQSISGLAWIVGQAVARIQEGLKAGSDISGIAETAALNDAIWQRQMARETLVEYAGPQRCMAVLS
jgi:hypothetical protein